MSRKKLSGEEVLIDLDCHCAGDMQINQQLVTGKIVGSLLYIVHTINKVHDVQIRVRLHTVKEPVATAMAREVHEEPQSVWGRLRQFTKHDG